MGNISQDFLVKYFLRQERSPVKIPWWLGTEEFSRDLVDNGKELYIIAGVYGQKSTLVSPDGYDINVPDHLWKVIVVMDEPGQTLADVNENTMAFAIDLPNIDPENDLVRDADGNLVKPTGWTDYVVSVRELETRLQLHQEVSSLDYNFLSNVAPSIQDIIENRS